MLARDRLSLREMSWILVKVFFGYGAYLVRLDGSRIARLTMRRTIQVNLLRLCAYLLLISCVPLGITDDQTLPYPLLMVAESIGNQDMANEVRLFFSAHFTVYIAAGWQKLTDSLSVRFRPFLAIR